MVEAPLASVFDMNDVDGQGCVFGTMMVRVDPQQEYYLDTETAPWKVGEETQKLKDRALISKIGGVTEARTKAINAEEDAGWYVGAKGQKILSVKLSDHCEHDESNFQRRPCGHMFCTRCDGFVDPASRVAMRGPGVIIACNRRPRPFDLYEHLFGENQAGSGVLTSGVQKALRNVS